MDKRTKIAIAMLNMYEGLECNDGYGLRIPGWLLEEHDGDCTKKAYTCNHCVSDQFYRYADMLLEFLGEKNVA